MITAFGIDLSGYSQGKSVLAIAQRDQQEVDLNILENTTLSTKLTGNQLLTETIQQERALIHDCCQRGRVMVDIPLDLQSLPVGENIRFVWELTRRPVDYALRGMPPLADRIGSAVARFQYMLAGLPEIIIGEHIFESYPALSLELMDLPSSRYKGTPIQYHNGRWHGELMAELATQLGFIAENGTQLNDDEFDAALCALAGVADESDCLQGDELHELINQQLRKKLGSDLEDDYQPPKGYCVLKHRPDNLVIQIQKTNLSSKNIQ